MQLITVKIEKPDDTNFILGQTHFIKSVEDRLSAGRVERDHLTNWSSSNKSTKPVSHW